MERIPSGRERIDWRLPEQRFVGTPDEVATRLDEVITALVAMRRALAPAAEPYESNAGRAALWAWLRSRLHVVVALAVTIGCLSVPLPVVAQTPAFAWSDVTAAATAEFSYQTGTNLPAGMANTFRVYDAKVGTFGLQQVTGLVQLAPAPDAGRRYGLRLDVQFGQATEALQGSDANEPRPEAYRHIWQAYGSFVLPGTSGIRVDAGKMASTLGIETNYAKDNQAYSRAFLFAFLPYYHTGVRVSAPVGNGLTLSATMANGANQTEDFNTKVGTLLTATWSRPGTVSWTGNYFRSRESMGVDAADGAAGTLAIWDSYVAVDLHPRVNIAVDANYSRYLGVTGTEQALTGLGVYGRVRLGGGTSVGIRYERLDDDGLFSSAAQVLQEITATVDWALAPGFLLRAEYRHDLSNADVFPAGAAGWRKRQPTWTLGGVWWIGNVPGTW